MNAVEELAPEVVQALLRRERLALVGRLLRGVVHNISGAMQMLRLPLDLIELKLAQGQAQDLGPKLQALQAGMARLGIEVEMLAAKSALGPDNKPARLSLPLLAAEELAFWKADMYFKHEAQVEADLPPAAFLVQASPADVALAFNALVANAVDSLRASGAKGLGVRYQEQEGQAMLLVADQGPGPSPQMVPAMFEPFTGDKGPEHDGLGLFLARQALASWGGEISWQPGPEPCFRLALPRPPA